MDGLIAYALSKKYADEVGRSIVDAGFKTQVEQDRSILQTVGQEKILYFIPKTVASSSDGYDEYVYSNNAWEQVGATDVDLSNYATKEWTTKQIEDAVGVLKTDIAGAVITLSQNVYTYDGISKAPMVVSVTLNGRALAAGTDYVVIANPATNAGQYIVTVSGIGGYTGTETVNWVINKVQATINGDDSITITGIDDPVTKTYTTDGDGAFSFTISENIATVANVGGEVIITPTAFGSTTMTVTLSEGANYLGTTKTVPVEIVRPVTVFGVVWDYSLSSPQLARLTPQTDPLSVVTTVPSQEPTACVGNDGNGQSDFDNYMPWAGMQRYNYVNGQVVDFVDYSNGETFVYIPEFWSKIVDDSVNSKMYFYISSSELAGFSKHPGSRRYVGRYSCDNDFMSITGAMPRVSTSLTEFRAGITATANHFQFDFHTYSALNLLYIVEYADFNSQAKIGEGITEDSDIHVVGETDILNYHTGRIGGANNQSAVQYRWIENLWGNVWNLIDAILINDHLIHICNNVNDYTSINNYINTQLTAPTDTNQYVKMLANYNNYYLMPKECGGSSSTYICDNFISNTGLRCLATGGRKDNALSAGMFCWSHYFSSNESSAATSSRSILILGGDS